VCYDLTSTYFEAPAQPSGRFPSRAFGYSRDHRGDRPQIVIGLLCTADGIPIAHHVFAGDTNDASTLAGVLEDLAGRFAVGRICLVGFTAGQKPIRPGLLLIKAAVVMGSMWAAWASRHPDEHQRHVAEILYFLATGVIQPRADRIYALDDFAAAFELFERNQGRGNTVVRFAPE